MSWNYSELYEFEQRQRRRAEARDYDDPAFWGRVTARVTAALQQLDNEAILLFGIIGDVFDGVTDSDVVTALDRLRDRDEVLVLLNSPGGDVTQGLAIYHALATHPATVTIEITGVAASMASAIAMAGDTVRIAENGHVMLHDPFMLSGGDAAELRKAAEMLDRFGTTLAGIYAGKTGIPEAQIRDMMIAETWFTAEEALAQGFVDEIVAAAPAEAFAGLDARCLDHFRRPIPASLAELVTAGCNTLNARRARARS